MVDIIKELANTANIEISPDIRKFAQLIISECINQLIVKQVQLTPDADDPDNINIWKGFHSQDVLAEVIFDIRKKFEVK